MTPRQDASLAALERWAVAAAAALFALVLLRDILWMQRGYALVDETFALRWAYEAAHGAPLVLGLGSGCINLLLTSCALRLPGTGPLALHAASLLSFFIECLLLGSLAGRLYGRHAAAAALLFNLACAFSLARARSMLSYTLMPCELLAIAQLMLARRPAWRVLGGFLGGLCLLDYEAWLSSGWMVLIALLFLFSRREKASPRAFAAGFAAGALGALWASRGSIQSFLAVRFAMSLHSGGQGVAMPWAQSLGGLIHGGGTLPSLGVSNHATLPLWSWPLLAWGILWSWRQDRLTLIWAALGCLALLPPSAAMNESNRAVAAWPAFCLLAGLGWRELWQRVPAAWFKPALILASAALALGAWGEAGAFSRSQDLHDTRQYGPGRSLAVAATWVTEESKKGPIRLLDNLGYLRQSEFEWMCREADLRDDAPRVIALLPFESLAGLGKDMPQAMVFRDPVSGSRSYLFEARGRWLDRLGHAENALAPAWKSLRHFDDFGTLNTLQAMLADPMQRDPWVRTSLWWRLMVTASIMDKVDLPLLKQLGREHLVNAGPLFSPSFYLLKHDAAIAAELHAQALRLDPRLNSSPEKAP